MLKNTILKPVHPNTANNEHIMELFFLKFK